MKKSVLLNQNLRIEILMIFVISLMFSCSTNGEKSIGEKVNAVSGVLSQKYCQSVRVAIRNDEERKEIERRKKIKTKHVFDLTNANKPFTDFRFDEVIAYDYEARGMNINQVNFGSIKQVKELNKKQVEDLINYLGAKSTYGRVTYGCYDPHLGLKFYYHEVLVAHISICLECNYLVSSVKIPAEEMNFEIIEGKKWYNDGFSELGVEKLSTLCRELEFSHCK